MTRDDSDSARGVRHRPPTNWPTAVLGIGALVFLGFVAWLCSGVATEWIAR